MSGKRRRLNVFTPRNFPAKSSSTYRLIPWTIDTTAMRNITLMVTPMSVKKLFSFWTRICASARRTASKRGMRKSTRRRGREGPRRSDPRAASRPLCTCVERGWLQPVTSRERLTAIVGRDETIAQHHHPPRVRGDVRLVRHHDHRLTLGRELLE